MDRRKQLFTNEVNLFKLLTGTKNGKNRYLEPSGISSEVVSCF